MKKKKLHYLWSLKDNGIIDISAIHEALANPVRGWSRKMLTRWMGEADLVIPEEGQRVALPPDCVAVLVHGNVALYDDENVHPRLSTMLRFTRPTSSHI